MQIIFIAPQNRAHLLVYARKVVKMCKFAFRNVIDYHVMFLQFFNWMQLTFVLVSFYKFGCGMMGMRIQ